MTITFTDDLPLQESLSAALDILKSASVEIGLPSTASPRSRWLLALHERGAPGAHIPPRPVIAPALESAEAQQAIADALGEACEAASDGEPRAVLDAFHRAGRAGVDAIHAYIDSGVPPPNAPLTVSGGWIRNFTSGRPVRVEGKGFNKPLYATGELYSSFGYEVRTK